MNDIFSIQRFGWLMRKIFIERTAQVLGTIGLCLMVTFIIYGMALLLQGLEVAQTAAFEIGLAAGGPLVASIVFSYFNNNANGASFLTLPASVLEKWLSGVLITGVLYFLLFLLVFRMIDLSFVAYHRHHLDPHLPYYKEQMEAIHTLSYTETVASGTYMLFFNFAGVVMLGALFFNKAAFVKTALIISSIAVGAFLLNLLMVSLLIKNTQIAFPFSIVWIWVGKERAALQFAPEEADKIKIIFRFILPAIFWGLSLVRLKEKEF
jgi:hypothetical protein